MLNIDFFLSFVSGSYADEISTALPVTWHNFVMLYF